MASYELPPVNSGLTGQVDNSFVAADQQLQGAYKHRKARKRIGPEHFQAVQSGRDKSVPATESGFQSQQQAGGTVKTSGAAVNQAERLRTDGVPDPAGLGVDVLHVAREFVAPAMPQIQGGDFSRSEDVQSLLAQFSMAETNGSTLTNGLQSMGRQQSEQQKQNSKVGGLVKKFGGIEKELTSKESGYLAKAQQFTKLAEKFSEISTQLATAATSIQSAAGSIEAAGAACAAIPFVGPAIAAALKIAAKTLHVVAKALQAISKQMNGISQAMKSSSVLNKASAAVTKVEKLSAQAKRLANQASLQRGLDHLKKITDTTQKMREALTLNLTNQKGLSQRLQQLKGDKSAQSGGGSRALYEQQLQQGVSRVETLKRLGAPGLDQQQRALLELYTRISGDNVQIAPGIDVRARNALAGSAYEPSVRLRLAVEKNVEK